MSRDVIFYKNILNFFVAWGTASSMMFDMVFGEHLESRRYRRRIKTLLSLFHATRRISKETLWDPETFRISRNLILSQSYLK